MGGEVISDTTIGLRAAEFRMRIRRAARNWQARSFRSNSITLSSPYRRAWWRMPRAEGHKRLDDARYAKAPTDVLREEISPVDTLQRHRERYGGPRPGGRGYPPRPWPGMVTGAYDSNLVYSNGTNLRVAGVVREPLISHRHPVSGHPPDLRQYWHCPPRRSIGCPASAVPDRPHHGALAPGLYALTERVL